MLQGMTAFAARAMHLADSGVQNNSHNRLHVGTSRCYSMQQLFWAYKPGSYKPWANVEPL
eukprot:SAG11_NODE_2223_length_3668_cov_2.062763_2_plen_60_part_00